MVRKGTYILIIRLPKPMGAQIGRLGEYEFVSGYYAYVGSALNSLDARLRRYFNTTSSRKHWHIDYLLEKAEPVAAFYCYSEKRMECRAANFLGRQYAYAIQGFGSSDCRCMGHLFYLGDICPDIFNKRKFILGGAEYKRW